RSRAADRTGRCDTATCGTDQPQGQLIVGVGRVRGAKLIDFGSDRRLAALHGLIQGTEDESNMWRELGHVHGGAAYLSPPLGGGVPCRRPGEGTLLCAQFGPRRRSLHYVPASCRRYG